MLRSLISPFVQRVAQRTLKKRDDFQCQLIPFGSYGLGAHTTGADMDLVFLGAWPVERRDFHHLFSTLLRKQPGVTDVDASRKRHPKFSMCCISDMSDLGNYADKGAHH